MKKLGFIILFSLAATSLFAQNWSMFQGDARHHAFDASTQDTLFQEALWTFFTGGAVFSSPVVHNRLVYFSSTDNYAYCLVDSTGELVWKTRLGSWCEATPAVANGLVYFACMDHLIYALNAATGELVWQSATESWIESSPIVVGEKIYIGGTDHHLYCINALSGEEIWRYAAEKDIYAAPAYANGTVYFGSDDYYFYAVDSLGQLKWRYWAEWYSIAASAAVTDSLVIFGTIDNGVEAGRETGEVNSRHNQIIALNTTDGTVRWRVTAENYGLMHTSPAIADGKLFYPTDRGVLRAVDLTDGQVVWEASMPDSSLMGSSPAIAAGVIYLTTYSGHLYLFGTDSGKVLGDFALSNDQVYIHASPAIANNYLFFGASDGNLYALGKVMPISHIAAEMAGLKTPELLPNYPNPFNPVTRIQYHLLQPENVTIKVINLQGQLVRILKNEFQLPGTYALEWDGRNDAHQAVASGTYLYQIQAGDFVQTRKMLLLK